jgi:hypothetical protein
MSFSADIEQFVLKSEKRLEGVVKESIKNVFNTAQIEVNDGGKMRNRKTNFLRASARASTEGFPSGPNIRPSDAQLNSFTYNGEAVIAVLNKMKLGQTFYFGWTANYAAARESHDGFLETAVQNWQQFVNTNSERFRGK